MSQPTADSSSPFGCSPAWLLALNGSGLAPRKPLSLCSQSAFQNATHLAATLRRIQAHKHHLRFCCSFCKKNSLTLPAYREFFLGQFYAIIKERADEQSRINQIYMRKVRTPKGRTTDNVRRRRLQDKCRRKVNNRKVQVQR